MENTPVTSKTNDVENFVRMDKAEYEKLYQLVDGDKFWQLDRAIEKAGGKQLERFFQDWHTASIFLNAIKTSGGLPERGMKYLQQYIKRLTKITETDKT
jgi:hypothetical protein